MIKAIICVIFAALSILFLDKGTKFCSKRWGRVGRFTFLILLLIIDVALLAWIHI